MKIGILTFHSQLNYGGVLQCWALQNALTRILNEKCRMKNEKCGEREKRACDEVVVIDRWLSPDNRPLEGDYHNYGARQWVKGILRALLGCGDFSSWLRHVRTKRFIRTHLNLTPYHFYSWKGAPNNMGLDCLVVGSDQVWHGGDWGDPRPYLLEEAPKIRAIAYAASFGMKSLPPEIDYAAGFRRFEAISVRESEGVRLVEETGYPNPVVHVVDPTLLLPRKCWYMLVEPSRKPRHLVCYFLSENVDRAIPILESWARENKWTVDIVCDENARSFPMKLGEAWSRLSSSLRLSRVHVRASAGPLEFVRLFAQADACITDSFHAVMFSFIYIVNVRFLKPQIEMRKVMFARIEEFARTSVKGKFFAEDLHAALASLNRDPRIEFDEEAISSRRNFSRNWLQAQSILSQ